MQQRRLGAGGPVVSAIGFGLMSLSSTYGPSDDEESVATIHRALDLGINFLDTAELYGAGHNERLASRVLEQRRDELHPRLEVAWLERDEASERGDTELRILRAKREVGRPPPAGQRRGVSLNDRLLEGALVPQRRTGDDPVAIDADEEVLGRESACSYLASQVLDRPHRREGVAFQVAL